MDSGQGMSDKDNLINVLASFGIDYDDAGEIGFNGDSAGCSGAHWAGVTFKFDDDGKFKTCNFDA